MPPQDMPPKGGFFFPKFRMSTLQPKGLTTYQIVFSFFGLWAFGFLSYRDRSEVASARALVVTAQTMCQRHIMRVMYGEPESVSQQTDPMADKWCGFDPSMLRPRDKRIETFISTIMNEEQRMLANQFRDATRDPLVAPYQVCYGPDNYPLPHVCDRYCITPEEIRAIRAVDEAKLQAKSPKTAAQCNH